MFSKIIILQRVFPQTMQICIVWGEHVFKDIILQRVFPKTMQICIVLGERALVPSLMAIAIPILLPGSCHVLAMLLPCYCRPHDDDEQRHLEKNKEWTTFAEKKLVPSPVHPGLADSRSVLNYITTYIIHINSYRILRSPRDPGTSQVTLLPNFDCT